MSSSAVTKASTSYARKAARAVSYADVNGNSVVTICVHTDIPFDVMVSVVADDSAKLLLRILDGRSTMLDAHVHRKCKA